MDEYFYSNIRSIRFTPNFYIGFYWGGGGHRYHWVCLTVNLKGINVVFLVKKSIILAQFSSCCGSAKTQKYAKKRADFNNAWTKYYIACEQRP